MTKFYQVMKTDVAVIEISDKEMKEFGYEGEIEEEENTIDWSGYDLKITETRR